MEPRLFGYVSYRDAVAGLDWLEALGFETVRRADGDDGTVLHAEVRLGQVVLMVASFDADYVVPPLIGQSTGRAPYLLVDAVEPFVERATAAGATLVFGPEDTEWGTRRARFLDPEGWEWNVGTYEPGVEW